MGPEPDDVYTSFLTNPIQLTGGATGRSGGQYHTLARDSSGNLYLAYSGEMVDDERSITIVRAAWDHLSFISSTSYTLGAYKMRGDGIGMALSESAGVVTVILASECDGEINISIARSDNPAGLNSTVSLGSYSHSGANFSLLIDEIGTLYVMHQTHGGIVLSRSANSGATWSHRNLDSHSSLAGGAYKSHLALDVSGQTIYAAYTTNNAHSNGYSVTLMKSIDGGATW